MNVLINELKKLGELSVKEEELLTNKIKSLKKTKGDFLLRKGKKYSCLFVLETGLVRGFFEKNGKEVNSWFGFENELLGSLLPIFGNKSSKENIQFLEDSTLYYIESNDLQKLYLTIPNLNLIGRKALEQFCLVLEERIISLQTETAEVRYKALMQTYPFINQRISLGHIASYLGITQETLSRIRQKL
jgi:CRP-like cAMP-binding protein